MAYQVGELDQLVTIRREVRVPDGMSGSKLEWQDVAEVWARVRPMSGRERLAAGQVEASANYLVVIHAGTEVLEKDIIVWDGQELNVRFPKRRGSRSLFLEIEAEMGVAM